MTTFIDAGEIRESTDKRRKALIEEAKDELNTLVLECIASSVQSALYHVIVKVRQLGLSGTTIEVAHIYEALDYTVEELKKAGYSVKLNRQPNYEGYEIEIRWDKAQYPPTAVEDLP